MLVSNYTESLALCDKVRTAASPCCRRRQQQHASEAAFWRWKSSDAGTTMAQALRCWRSLPTPRSPLAGLQGQPMGHPVPDGGPGCPQAAGPGGRVQLPRPPLVRTAAVLQGGRGECRGSTTSGAPRPSAAPPAHSGGVRSLVCRQVWEAPSRRTLAWAAGVCLLPELKGLAPNAVRLEHRRRQPAHPARPQVSWKKTGWQQPAESAQQSAWSAGSHCGWLALYATPAEHPLPGLLQLEPRR